MSVELFNLSNLLFKIILTFLIFSLVFTHRAVRKKSPRLLSNYPPQVLKEAGGNANMCHCLEYEFVEIRISA